MSDSSSGYSSPPTSRDSSSAPTAIPRRTVRMGLRPAPGGGLHPDRRVRLLGGLRWLRLLARGRRRH
eukprot:6660588-Alexandrium_andersonii.AAC.1